MKKVFSAVAVSLLASTAFASEVISTDPFPQGKQDGGQDHGTLSVTGKISQSTCRLEAGSLTPPASSYPMFRWTT